MLQLGAYGSPAALLFMMYVPVTVYLPQLYAKYTGMGFALIGTIILVSRMFDSIADQVIGILSDGTRTRLGKRKPWLIAGTFVLLPSLYFLFDPPHDAGPLRLGAALSGFYLGWTMIFIPYMAWAAELGTSFEERNRIASAYGIGHGLGQLGFNLVPLALVALGFAATTDFSIGVLRAVFWIVATALPFSIAVIVLGVPSIDHGGIRTPGLVALGRALGHNRPFLIYAAAFSLFTASSAAQSAIAFTFYDSYLHIGPYIPYLVISVVVASTASVPVWTAICGRIGKHRAWALGWVLSTLALQGFWFLSPGPSTVWALWILLTINGICDGVNAVAPNAILADIVDYGAWKSGEARAGSYFAAQAFLMKLAQAGGAGLGFLLLAAFGFQVKAHTVNDSHAITGMLVTLILVPSLLKLAAFLTILAFPLDRRRHNILCRRIATRNARSAVSE